ncbi:MAG: glycoside hydrolase family 140 protein [Alistipes sp.]|nr:glycoside hydrolase family 140 protein [Alistipes sp.]
MKKLITLLILLTVALMPLQAQNLPQLKVSDNGHYLQTTDGKPFFYQGDTAWELFHRLDREDADLYLQNRAAKGYNVIQAVALAECDGVDANSAYGYKPLVNRNPAQPAVVEGDNNDYWDHVDYIVAKANSLGLYVAMLPTWGRYWNDDNPIFTPQNAEVYGRWIAERYHKYNIIWILGGDRNPDNDYKLSIIRAMARGIQSVDKHNLITYHPTGWETSSRWFHKDEWLDFNSRQSGHHQRYNSNERIMEDFRRSPSKPIMEIEPLYEDHPLEFRPDEDGHSNSWDVRRAIYWSVFYGSAGVTYGHHSVWQMYDKEKGRGPINRPLMEWKEAINQPAAGQVVYLKNLILSRPYFSRVPAPEFIVQSDVHSSVPGAGRYRFVATMDTEGSYAMVYAPLGREFSVNTSMLKAEKITAWWYCPRTGKAQKIGSFANDGAPRSFISPNKGESIDWVLVLDDASKHYPAPGRKLKEQK